jgi:hypothetical protein
MKVEGLKINARAIGEFLKGGAVQSLVGQKASQAASIAAGIYTDRNGQTTYDVLGPEINATSRRARAAVIVRSPAPQQRAEGRRALASAGESVSDSFVRRN